jgi:hypothetical protein
MRLFPSSSSVVSTSLVPAVTVGTADVIAIHCANFVALKKTKQMYTERQKDLVIKLCTDHGVDAMLRVLTTLGGSWSSLKKKSLKTWIYRSNHAKLIPGPKVHLEFEHDVLEKVMLVVLQRSQTGGKSVHKVLISVLYSYDILIAAGKDTQADWKV